METKVLSEISHYKSYRQYLRDFLSSQKNSQLGFSHGSFAKEVGLSPAALAMILEGSRNLTISKVHDFAQKMKFRPIEYEYWESLVHFEQAKSAGERTFYSRKLKQLKTNKQLDFKNVVDRELLKDWRIPAMTCYLVDLKAHEPDGNINLQRLRKSLGFSLREITELIEVLELKGIIEKAEDHQIHFVFDKLGQSLTKQAYLDQLLEVTKKKMKLNFKSPEHYFEGHTISLSNEKIQQFKKDYKALVDSYMSEPLDGTKKNHVVKVFTSMFPVL